MIERMPQIITVFGMERADKRHSETSFHIHAEPPRREGAMGVNKFEISVAQTLPYERVKFRIAVPVRLA